MVYISWPTYLSVSIPGRSNEGRVSGQVTTSVHCRVILGQKTLHSLIPTLLEWNEDMHTSEWNRDTTCKNGMRIMCVDWNWNAE